MLKDLMTLNVIETPDGGLMFLSGSPLESRNWYRINAPIFDFSDARVKVVLEQYENRFTEAQVLGFYMRGRRDGSISTYRLD